MALSMRPWAMRVFVICSVTRSTPPSCPETCNTLLTTVSTELMKNAPAADSKQREESDIHRGENSR